MAVFRVAVPSCKWASGFWQRTIYLHGKLNGYLFSGRTQDVHRGGTRIILANMPDSERSFPASTSLSRGHIIAKQRVCDGSRYEQMSSLR